MIGIWITAELYYGFEMIQTGGGMLQRLQIAIPTLILASLICCSQTGIVLHTPPVWIEQTPVLPGYFIATGTQTGGENAGGLAAQLGREE